MDCQERLVEHVERVRYHHHHHHHQSATTTKLFFVYRNIVKALPWFSSVREKIEDPAYQDWFLKFDYSQKTSYHAPTCTGDKCSLLYHDQEQTPQHPGLCREECDCGKGIPCGEYLFDHRNESLREWIIEDFVLGGLTEDIRGFFLDDEWTDKPCLHKKWYPKYGFCCGDQFGGPTEVRANCTIDMGLTQQDVTDITGNWSLTRQLLAQRLVEQNAFEWHLFLQSNASPSREECMSTFRTQCTTTGNNESSIQQSAWMALLSRDNNNQLPIGDSQQILRDITAFLILRGPFAWLGYGWIGCTGSGTEMYARPRELDLDYGEPEDAVCHQTQPGVFTRRWTKAIATFDCNTYQAEIVMLDNDATNISL